MNQPKTNEVKDYFNQPSKYLHKNYGIRIRRELIQSIVTENPPKQLLDMGCGDGTISLPLINANTQLTLVDLSDNMLAVAIGNIPVELKGNVNAICSGLNEYQTEKKYDTILAIGLLAHVPSIPEAILKLKSLLKKDGTLIIQFSDYEHFVTRLYFTARNKNLHQLNEIRKAELDSVCAEAGLSINKQIGFGNVLPGMGRLSDSFLYSFVKYTCTSRWMSFYNSEYIYALKIK